MKRCPECRRDYVDETLLYCLEDGAALVQGSVEPATAILHDTSHVREAATQAQIHETDRTAVLPSRAVGVPKSRRAIVVPLVLAVIALTGFFGYRYFGSNNKQIESIAVMPFVNESNFAEDEYLSDGMTESLIRALSQLPGLNVKSRSSVFRYKGKDIDPKTIAHELGVEAMLSGRVVQRSDNLVLTLELIETSTENVLWAEQYERKASDLISLQNEIARDVSIKLKSKLSGDDQQKLTKNYTVNPDAYRLYLQGRFYWNKRDENGFKKAIDCFTQATTLDPDYALAYAGLADTYLLLSSFGFLPPSEGMPKAQVFARRAMSLDESLAEPHASLAVTLQSYEYDFVEAEREYRKAIDLNPKYLTGHQWYGELLVCAGRFDEADASYRRALELDPLSVPANWEYARMSYYARRFDESIERHKKILEMDPQFQGAYRTIAEAYRVKGDFAKAAEAQAKYFDLGGEPRTAETVRTTFAKEGWNGVLRLITSENSPLKNRHAVVARAYIELGEKDKAFAELNRGVELRETPLQWLKVEPQFDPLRDDPRFQELMKKIHFAE